MISSKKRVEMQDIEDWLNCLYLMENSELQRLKGGYNRKETCFYTQMTGFSITLSLHCALEAFCFIVEKKYQLDYIENKQRHIVRIQLFCKIYDNICNKMLYGSFWTDANKMMNVIVRKSCKKQGGRMLNYLLKDSSLIINNIIFSFVEFLKNRYLLITIDVFMKRYINNYYSYVEINKIDIFYYEVLDKCQSNFLLSYNQLIIKLVFKLGILLTYLHHLFYSSDLKLFGYILNKCVKRIV